MKRLPVKMFFIAATVAMMLSAYSCGDEAKWDEWQKQLHSEAEPPPAPRQNEAVILNTTYEIQALRYFDGYYPFIGEDCVCLHIEFIGGAQV